MNPAKRKKLLRLELAEKNQELTAAPESVKQIKVETVTQVVEQLTSVESSNLEMGLKLIEDSKKDKKKKTTTQES